MFDSICVCVHAEWACPSPPRRSLPPSPSSLSSSSCHPPSSSCLCRAGCRPARPSRVVRTSDPEASAQPSDPESTHGGKTSEVRNSHSFLLFLLADSSGSLQGSAVVMNYIVCPCTKFAHSTAPLSSDLPNQCGADGLVCWIV